MGELINSIVTSSNKVHKAKPNVLRDNYGFYYFNELPENSQLIKEEDYRSLGHILSVGNYFLIESAVTGHYELHKVRKDDNVFTLWRYILAKQLYLYTP